MFRQIRRAISIVILAAFIITSVKSPALAQVDPMPFMPKPGVMIHLSPEFTPAYLKGIVIHPENALKFDFIVFKGDKVLTEAQKREEYTKLTKYFLASLAIPDDDQWVNLSPYEKDRIIKNDFGKTEMGRDLLAQDYMLKQITASLIYPEDNLGKKFWDRVYSQAQEQFGTIQIPVNTFNKVWILPDDAVIYEKGNTAYVLKNHLRVMLEEDYLALQKHSGIQNAPMANKTHIIASKIVKEIVLPELEREVNEGKNFAALRQVYSGMLLAAWYKRALKESFLSKIYANKGKVKGVDQDPQTNEAIYRQYLKAYKKGVFNFIKEDVDKYTNETIPRKYFSGGTGSFAMTRAYTHQDPIHVEFSMTHGETDETEKEVTRDKFEILAIAARESPKEPAAAFRPQASERRARVKVGIMRSEAANMTAIEWDRNSAGIMRWLYQKEEHGSTLGITMHIGGVPNFISYSLVELEGTFPSVLIEKGPEIQEAIAGMLRTKERRLRPVREYVAKVINEALTRSAAMTATINNVSHSFKMSDMNPVQRNNMLRSRFTEAVGQDTGITFDAWKEAIHQLAGGEISDGVYVQVRQNGPWYLIGTVRDPVMKNFRVIVLEKEPRLRISFSEKLQGPRVVDQVIVNGNIVRVYLQAGNPGEEETFNLNNLNGILHVAQEESRAVRSLEDKLRRVTGGLRSKEQAISDAVLRKAKTLNELNEYMRVFNDSHIDIPGIVFPEFYFEGDVLRWNQGSASIKIGTRKAEEGSQEVEIDRDQAAERLAHAMQEYIEKKYWEDIESLKIVWIKNAVHAHNVLSTEVSRKRRLERRINEVLEKANAEYAISGKERIKTESLRLVGEDVLSYVRDFGVFIEVDPVSIISDTFGNSNNYQIKVGKIAIADQNGAITAGVGQVVDKFAKQITEDYGLSEAMTSQQQVPVNKKMRFARAQNHPSHRSHVIFKANRTGKPSRWGFQERRLHGTDSIRSPSARTSSLPGILTGFLRVVGLTSVLFLTSQAAFNRKVYADTHPAAIVEKVNGGIDFNSANLNLKIKRDGNGVPLPIGQQDMASLSHLEGLEPVVLDIHPASMSTPFFSQLKNNPSPA